MKLPLILAIIASPAAAQEFTFEDFDFETPTEVAPLTVLPQLQMSAVVGLNHTNLNGLTTTDWAAQINLANEHNLSLGYLEWAANVQISEGDVAFDVSRIHLQNSAGDFSWKLGKYRIGWGEVESAPVLDVLNPALSFSDIGLASDELPGQWFLGLDYFVNGNAIAGFVNVAPDVEHTLAGTNTADYEFGVQARFPINNGQISLYGAQLLPQSGVIDLSDMTSTATPYTLAGISANYTIGNALLEVDLAGKFGLQRSTLAGLSSHDRVDLALGVEYAATQSMQISAALIAQHWLDQTEVYLTPSPLGLIESGQTSVSYLVGVSDSFYDSKLSLSANLGGTVDGSTGFTALSAIYTFSDALSLSASAMLLSAEAGSALVLMDGFQQFGLTATYTF